MLISFQGLRKQIFDWVIKEKSFKTEWWYLLELGDYIYVCLKIFIIKVKRKLKLPRKDF